MNFLLLLGSVGVFAAIQVFFVLITTLVIVTRLQQACKCCQRRFSFQLAWLTSLTFIHGVFLEVAVASSISLNLLPLTDYLNDADNFSFYVGLAFMGILICFVAFVAFFTLCKSTIFANKYRSDLVGGLVLDKGSLIDEDYLKA